MYNSDTELYFPLRCIPALGSGRGDDWQVFIDGLTVPEENRMERIALVYLMVKLCGCGACNADSFRAMKGCVQCARQAIKRFRGSDADLIHQHSNLQKEVEEFLLKVN